MAAQTKGEYIMSIYVGTRIVEATPMTRGDYNIFRGWTIPQDENPQDEGYLIKSDDGHVHWFPKDIFEKHHKESIATKELTNDLLTTKYTKVYHEDEDKMRFNAPHHFEVWGPTGMVGTFNFQEGPIQECGVNGVMNEDLIAMVISRLEHFNRTEFSCKENAMAITKLEEALLWLRKRTMAREKRGVEGTHTV